MAGAVIPDDVAVESGSPGIQGSPMDDLPKPEEKPKFDKKGAVGGALSGLSEGMEKAMANRQAPAARPSLEDRVTQVSRDVWARQERGDFK